MITNRKSYGLLAATAIVCTLPAGYAAGEEVVAGGESTIAGSVSGSYLDTWTADGFPEEITEQETRGGAPNRTSKLNHMWVFDLPPGDTVTLFVRAWHTANDEDDHFTFAWSPEPQGFTNVLTVTSTSDPGGYVSALLPSGTSGTLYVRAQDTDRTKGNRDLDTLFVDHLYIESVSGGPPAAPSNLRTMDLSPSAIFMRWNDYSNNEEGFRVERWDSGTGWSVAATLAADTTSFEDGGLSPATYYEYVVYAVSSDGDSPPSRVSGATTRPPGAYGVDLVDEPWANHTSLDHDPLTGRPGIGYRSYDLCFASHDGTGWSVETPEHGGRALSFAYSPDGIASIAHVTETWQGDLRFVERIGGTWISQLIDDGVDGQWCTSLAFGPAGEPAIAYHKVTGPGKNRGLRLARRSGGSWSTELVEKAAEARYVSLTFDPDGNPAIAYSDDPANGLSLAMLKLARWGGTSWDVEVVETGVVGYGVWPSLSFDPTTGHPAVSHGLDPQRILAWDGSEWQLLGVFGNHTSLVHDPWGVLYVAYIPPAAHFELYLATFDGTWSHELVDDWAWPNGNFVLGLDLDPATQQPKLSFPGGALGVTALKFASR